MKKTLSIVIILILAIAGISVFAACEKKTENETVDVKIVVPDGAPALAIAKLLKDKPAYEGYNITYEIVAGAQEISAAMLNGDADFAIAPTNIASILYNGGIAKLLSVNVHGVLYLVGTDNVASLAGLKGKTVYNIGQGGTPDITFKYLLSQNNIAYGETADENTVGLQYVSSGAELIPILKLAKQNSQEAYGILGEPAATQAIRAAGVTRLFDIQALWENLTSAAYPQASFIANNSFLTAKNKPFIEWLLTRIEENDQWIKDNPAEAGQALKDAGSTLTVTFDTAIIDNCNVETVRAAEAKLEVNAYLSVLFGFQANSVGGKLPDDGFYYEA
jgi:ABC-type nitrate/sulfonate/bicarbonate transport systems, periplasmic components